jgi:hypothetical protein
MVAKALFSVFIIISIFSVAHAEIYRWTDKDGNTQFSDRPLNSKTKTVEVDTQRNSYGGGRVLERQRDLLDEYQADDAQQLEKNQQAAKQAVKDKRLQASCINAKDRLKNFQRGALYRLDANGERIYYSEEERTNALNKYQQSIEKNCK